MVSNCVQNHIVETIIKQFRQYDLVTPDTKLKVIFLNTQQGDNITNLEGFCKFQSTYKEQNINTKTVLLLNNIYIDIVVTLFENYKSMSLNTFDFILIPNKLFHKQMLLRGKISSPNFFSTLLSCSRLTQLCVQLIIGDNIYTILSSQQLVTLHASGLAVKPLTHNGK